MSSLKQLKKKNNHQKTEIEIERGQTKFRALIPERPFIATIFAILATALAYLALK